MSGFADLSIMWNACPTKLCENARAASTLGYKIIVINNFVEELSIKTSKKVKDKVVALTPAADIKIPVELFCSLQSQAQTVMRQFTRFTAVMSDLTQCIRLKDQVIQDYDILAIQPTTPKVFQEACKTYNIDLISLDLSQRLDGMLIGKSAHAAIGCAIGRGVHFEILYAPMLRDSTARRMTITNANMLVELCRGKNIIISSGCEKSLELRGPYDIANLALLFGLSDEQAKHTVTTNCRSLLLHAAARKSASGVVSCMKLPSSRIAVEQLKVVNTDSNKTVREPPHKKTKSKLVQ